MVCYGMVWYGMVWYGMVWYGMVWYGMVWYGVVWYGVVWWEMVWYGTVATKPSVLAGIIWTTNQPIPSAEEKLTGSQPAASVPPVSTSSAVAPARSSSNSMSTWLVLRNLSPRVVGHLVYS